MIYELLISQLSAHVIADFYLQSNNFCAVKNEHGAHCWQMYVHILVVFLVSYIFSSSFSFWWAALVIAISHWILDCLKSKYYTRPWSFFIDQILHISVIVSMVGVYYHINTRQAHACLNVHHLLYVFGLLVVLKPINIAMREFMSSAKIMVPSVLGTDTIELPNAGKWIGVIERLLSYIFVLMGEFEAIGFLIAAKSILRFNDKDVAKSEYVLVGTLLSFASAIVIGMIVKKCCSII